jgi:hypothetical protein
MKSIGRKYTTDVTTQNHYIVVINKNVLFKKLMKRFSDDNSDFTLADKEWIDKTDPEKITLDDIL